MGDRNLTLFALHAHGDVQIGPASVPGIGSGDEASHSGASSLGDGTEDGAGEAGSDGSGSGAESSDRLGALLVGLLVLAAAAVVIKKLRGGTDSAVDMAESDDL